MHAEIENRMVVDSQWPEDKPLLQCVCNGCNIYEGDDYYDVNGYIVCEDCKIKYINRFRRVANE